MVDVHDDNDSVPADVAYQMYLAKMQNHHLVVNLSLEGPANYKISSTADRTGCTSSLCQSIRRQQEQFYEGFLAVLDSAILLDPSLADNTLICVIAGNGGVDLDTQIANLKTRYPNAFARMVIVGGTDAGGNIYPEFNHLADNSVPNMVYARAINVQPNGCDGTSFAGPEVTSVLDAIWAQTPKATSAKVLAAIYRVLAQTGTNNIIPADANGKVTTNFINNAVTLINSSFFLNILTFGPGSVTASPSGPFYTPGTTVNLTAIPQINSTFYGWAGDASGTGAAILNMTNDKSVYAHFSTGASSTSESYVGFASTTYISTNTYPTQDASGDPVQWSPNPQICTDVINTYPVTLSVSGSLLQSNSFTAEITEGPYSEVFTYPTETYTLIGNPTVVYPGSTTTTTNEFYSFSVAGTGNSSSPQFSYWGDLSEANWTVTATLQTNNNIITLHIHVVGAGEGFGSLTGTSAIGSCIEDYTLIRQ
jgi:hypothetical protein